jgi:hypothetical protein
MTHIDWTHRSKTHNLLVFWYLWHSSWWVYILTQVGLSVPNKFIQSKVLKTNKLFMQKNANIVNSFGGAHKGSSSCGWRPSVTQKLK